MNPNAEQPQPSDTQPHQGILYALGAVESDLSQAEGSRTSIRDTAEKMGKDVQRNIDGLEKQTGDPTTQEAHRKAILDRRMCQLVGHDDSTSMEDTWDED